MLAPRRPAAPGWRRLLAAQRGRAAPRSRALSGRTDTMRPPASMPSRSMQVPCGSTARDVRVWRRGVGRLAGLDARSG